MSRVHQVAHHQAGVFVARGGSGVLEHADSCGCAVERVAACAHDTGVKFGKTSQKDGFLHYHHLRALLAVTSGGVGSGFQHGCKQLGHHLLLCVFTAAASVLQIDECFLHKSCFTCWLLQPSAIPWQCQERR